MSAAPHDEPEEPDLTAMLDLVLQLVMFFIAVAHIDNEQKDQSVVLPQASIARSIAKDYSKIVIINVIPVGDGDDGVFTGGPVKRVKYSVFEGYNTSEYTDVRQLRTVLESKFNADKLNTPPTDWEAGKGRSLIVLRAHKDCNFRQVFGVMTTARSVGFRDVQLRANITKSA